MRWSLRRVRVGFDGMVMFLLWGEEFCHGAGEEVKGMMNSRREIGLWPDIMFVVCACARFHVTPKTSHLHAVKRIFKYLKGQPELGLWYPRDLPFDLEAFSDSDYVRATLDEKSTIGGSAKQYDWIGCNNTKDLRITLGFNRQALNKDTKLPQTSVPIPNVPDEAVCKELDDSVERATTTATSLDAAQDSEFGDFYKAPKADEATVSASDGSVKKKGRIVTVIADDMQKRRNDVKVRTTLLLALPDEHHIRFSKYKTAQELWAAILKTFGGNEATKKTKKNLLKQQYGNFKAEGSETLEQTFNRLQVIVSQLEFMDIEIEKEDLNQKFLTSLAPEWLMHTIVWRNRSDLDTISLDDLYNHLKVYEAPKSQDRGRRDNFRQGSKVKEQTPKALMEIDGVRWDWSFIGNEQEDHVLVADEEVPTEFALMAKTSSKSEVFDNSLCSKNCKKNTKSLNNKITDLDDKLFDSKNMLFHNKAGLAQVEGRLAEFKNQEIKFCEKIKGLKLQVGFKNDRIESFTNELEFLKKEKGELETKLTGFQSATKNLDNLLESQRLDKNKEGLGYSVIPPLPAQVYSPPKKDMS
nr:ribonuclease H-like domain-containing protein [Tanacetum cinerariifolium]